MIIIDYPGKKADEILSREGLDYTQILETVKPISKEVRTKGDKALFKYSKKFDNYELTKENIQVSQSEIKKAVKKVGGLSKALRKASANIKAFHKMQYLEVDREWDYYVSEGVKLGERTTPIESVGCYVPGGLACYPSTVLMTCIPAKIAGVKRIVVVSPPPISDAVLAACSIAGVNEVYQVGGAQAIAALAYGTESIKPVDKIVGPGNKYVTAAKMLVYGTCDIDMPAGPSEILILADKTANPSYIVSDILAQAEHDPNAQSVLVTDSNKIAAEVKSMLGERLDKSPRKTILAESVKKTAIIRVKNMRDGIDYANKYAPEHLEIIVKKPIEAADRIKNAGAVFVGPYSPVAAGDYASGGNHVLPTSGAARFSSPLTVRDYLKTTCIQEISQKGLQDLSETIQKIAESEGLVEHKKSIDERLK